MSVYISDVNSLPTDTEFSLSPHIQTLYAYGVGSLGTNVSTGQSPGLLVLDLSGSTSLRFGLGTFLGPDSVHV